MKLNLQTKKSAPLHPDETRSEFDPALTADGRWLSFVQSRGKLSLALVVKDLREDRRFEAGPVGGFSGLHSPAIPPDASRVLYSFPDEGRQHLMQCTIECKDAKRLVDSTGINNWPDFSPDGSEFVFSSTRDGNYELYLVHPDGTGLTRVASHPEHDNYPCWSPDSRSLYFVGERGGQQDILKLTLPD